MVCMEMDDYGKIKDRVKFRDRNQIHSLLLLTRPPVLCLQFPVIFYKIFSAVSKEKLLQAIKVQLKMDH